MSEDNNPQTSGTQNDTSVSAGKKVRQKARELRPREVLRAMGEQGPVTMAELKKIVARKYPNPVIISTFPLIRKKSPPNPRGWFGDFHSLKTSALKGRKDYIATLTKRPRETLSHDWKEIEEFLAEYFEPQNFHSLVILWSGHELNRVIKLGVHVPEAFVIDPDPFVAPLEKVLESIERVLLVEVAKKETRFSLYRSGMVRDFVEYGKTRSTLEVMERNSKFTSVGFSSLGSMQCSGSGGILAKFARGAGTG